MTTATLFCAGLSAPRPSLFLPAMPFEVHFRGGQKLKPGLDTRGIEPVFTLSAKTEAEFEADEFLDWEILSRSLIDSFLAVTTPAEALFFLTLTGHFLWDAWSTEQEFYSETLTWSEFQFWQDLIRDIQTNGFLCLNRDENAACGISCAAEIPIERFDERRRQLVFGCPESTFHLLNGSIAGFELVHRYDPERPDGPSNRALVVETLTSIDTMLARLSIEQLLQS